jgi:hypothetical protein
VKFQEYGVSSGSIQCHRYKEVFWRLWLPWLMYAASRVQLFFLGLAAVSPFHRWELACWLFMCCFSYFAENKSGLVAWSTILDDRRFSMSLVSADDPADDNHTNLLRSMDTEPVQRHTMV